MRIMYALGYQNKTGGTAMLNEVKTSFIEAAAAVKAGRFISVRGYINSNGEKSNFVVHADSNYASVHERSAKMLKEIAADDSLALTFSRNFYTDENGMEHTRKAKGRTMRTKTETVGNKDPDFIAAVEKVMQGIVAPKEIEDNNEKLAGSLYENSQTNKVYLRNVLVHSKEIIRAGIYPVTCSSRVNCIADELRKMLPIEQYRSYVLSEETVDIKNDKGEVIGKEPKLEYVALAGEKLTSSSSSED